MISKMVELFHGRQEVSFFTLKLTLLSIYFVEFAQ